VQILILLPDAKRAHWRLGYFLCVLVGLYLPRKRLRLPPILDVFLQIGQNFAILNTILEKIIRANKL
jgi:hypothetical protein